VAEETVRVLFDAHQVGRRQTGNETYVRSLLGELASRPDVAVTALLEPAAVHDPGLAGSMRRRKVPRSGVLRLAAMALLSRRLRPDVLHAIYFGPVLAGVPVVLTVHDISYEIHPQFFSRSSLLRDRILIRDSARRARVVVTVSETSRRDLIERYGLREDRVVAIPNGVSRRFLSQPPRPTASIGERPVRILAIGTLQPRKNLLRLLAAVRRVAAERPVHLRVVGPDGYQASVIRDALAGARDVAVDVVGFVSDEDLPTEYAAADMLVYPSLYEGFGLPVVEAMAMGLPVVTSTRGALPEVAGDAALIVDPLDEAAIAAAIARLTDDDELRRELVARGRERAKRYSWVDAADKHVAVYREAAG
jgi:glycosyltransferase involved in cell wall biosynthesis